MKCSFGACQVDVREAQAMVFVTLPDGARITAAPNHDPESIARAHELGYGGDVRAMTLDHDPLHVIVCHALGLPESPALRDAVNGVTTELGLAEEGVVLALQRFVNLCRERERNPSHGLLELRQGGG
jgi:hypothetical protein